MASHAAHGQFRS
jgi:hypothetical protein